MAFWVLGATVLVLGAAIVVFVLMLVLGATVLVLGPRIEEDDDDDFFLGGDEAKWTPPALAMASWLRLRVVPFALRALAVLLVPLGLLAVVVGGADGGCNGDDEETDDSLAVGLGFASKETRED